MPGAEDLVEAAHRCPALPHHPRPDSQGMASAPITPGSPVIARALRTASTASPVGNPRCAWANLITSCRSTPASRPPASPGPRHTRPCFRGLGGGFLHQLAGATPVGGLGRYHWLDSLPPPQGTGRLVRGITLVVLW